LKHYFKFLVTLVFMLNLTNNVRCITIQVPNENKIPTQEVDRLQAIKEKGVVVIASTGDEPFIFEDRNTGQITGINGDILQEVMKRLEIPKIEIKKYPFSKLLNQLNINPEIDFVVDRTYSTPERKKIYAFSNYLYKEYPNLVTNKYSKIVFEEDLVNAVVGAVGSTVFEDTLSNMKKEGKIKDYKTFDNDTDLMQAVSTGKIDAALAGSIIAKYLVAQYPNIQLKPIELKASTTAHRAGGSAFAFRKSDRTLLDAINDKIDDMKIDGTLYAILNKYGLDSKYYL
jgi:polar amino acid transport system substrate-binding protein